MQQQVRNVLWECEDRGIDPRFLIHDRDGCFSPEFDAVLKQAGIEPIKTPFRAPNANAYAERWVRSICEECLNHLILFGLDSLRRTVGSYRAFLNERRPHQGIGNRVPVATNGEGG
jgi:transposase InsO family protein